MCHVSCVTFHLSRVNSHMLKNIYKRIRKIFQKNKTINTFKKIGQSGGASRWRVCYQWDLPRLVFLYCNTIKTLKQLSSISKSTCNLNNYSLSVYFSGPSRQITLPHLLNILSDSKKCTAIKPWDIFL